MKSRDLKQLNTAIAAAEERSMTKVKRAQKALYLREQLLKEKTCINTLEAAVAKNEIAAPEPALVESQELGLKSSSAYKDAVSALNYLREVEDTVTSLLDAYKKKEPTEIVKYLTKMAELGKTYHPAVKAETEKQIKILNKNFEASIEREDLYSLKRLRPQATKFNLEPKLNEKVSNKIKYLEKKPKRLMNSVPQNKLLKLNSMVMMEYLTKIINLL